MTTFYETLKFLDDLKLLQKIDQQNCEDLINMLITQVEHKYFFENLDNPAWLEPLHDIGFFYSPPDMVEVENGYQSPWWWEGDYLERFAKEFPNVILDLIQNIETNNYRVYWKLIEIVPKIPIEFAVEGCDSICKWFLREPQVFEDLLLFSVGKLLDHYLVNGNYEEALKLSISIMVPRQSIKEPMSEDEFYYRDPVVFIDKFWVEEALQKENRMEQVIQALPIESFEKLLSLYQKAYELTLSVYPEDREDSLIRKLIYPRRVVRQSHSKNYLEVILDFLEIAMQRCCLSNQEYMECLLDKFLDKDQVYQMLALITLSVHGELFPSLLETVCNQTSFVDDGLLDLFFLRLWQLQYQKIPKEAFSKIVNYIVGKPPKSDSEMDIRSANYKKRIFLVPVIDHLEGETKEKAKTLVPDVLPSDKDYGEIPIITEWIDSRQNSPINQEEFQKLTDDELVSNIMGYSENEVICFSEVLQDCISLDPARYESLFTRVVNRNANQYIIRGFLRGFEQYLQHPKENFITEKTLQPLLIIVQRGKKEGMKTFFSVIADIISKQFDFKDISLSEYEIELSVEILTCIIVNRVVEPIESNQGFDPLTTSLNNPYTVGLRALLQLWVHLILHHKNNPSFTELITKSKTTLNHQLDEPNPYGNLTFGHFLPHIIQYAPAWFDAIAYQLFPKNDPERWEMTWIGYIVYRNPVKTSYQTLMPYYQESINRLESFSKTKLIGDTLSEKIGDHIFQMYIWEWIELDSDDNLLRSFFTKADDETRHSVIFNIGMGMENYELSPEDMVWGKLWKLWKWRFEFMAEAKDYENFSRELRAFSRWVGKIPLGLEETYFDLETILQYSNDDFPLRGITSYAARNCKENIEKAVQLLLISEQNPPETWRMWKEEDLHTILDTVSKSDNAQAKEFANEFINLRGETGDFEWKDYLNEGFSEIN